MFAAREAMRVFGAVSSSFSSAGLRRGATEKKDAVLPSRRGGIDVEALLCRTGKTTLAVTPTSLDRAPFAELGTKIENMFCTAAGAVNTQRARLGGSFASVDAEAAAAKTQLSREPMPYVDDGIAEMPSTFHMPTDDRGREEEAE